MVVFSIGIIVFGIGIVGCVNKTAIDQEGEKQVIVKTIEEVLKDHTEELMSLPGVVGTAQGLCNVLSFAEAESVLLSVTIQMSISEVVENHFHL